MILARNGEKYKKQINLSKNIPFFCFSLLSLFDSFTSILEKHFPQDFIKLHQWKNSPTIFSIKIVKTTMDTINPAPKH